MEGEALALLASAIGGVCAATSTFLVSRNKVRVAEVAVARTNANSDAKLAFDNLLVVVDQLRKELAVVRGELDEERLSRRAADTRSYALREELHALRNSIQPGVLKGQVVLTPAT